MATVKIEFSDHEQECLRFLAKHYDQQANYINVRSIPVYETLGMEGTWQIVERFQRFGLVELRTNEEITILPKMIEVAQQLAEAIQNLTKQTSQTFQYTIFLSYASGDAHLANELKNTFEEKGVQCFMAEKDITVATQWEMAIREALRASKYILLLLTPRSIDRPWVLLETGAAWALEKDIIPVLVHVEPEKLIEPIRRYQAWIIETTEQRMNLAEKLIEKYKGR